MVQSSIRINADPPIRPKINKWLQSGFKNILKLKKFSSLDVAGRIKRNISTSEGNFYGLMSKRLNLEFPDSIQNIVSMLNNNLIKKPGLFALEWDQDGRLKSALLLFLLRATRGQHQSKLELEKHELFQ